MKKLLLSLMLISTPVFADLVVVDGKVVEAQSLNSAYDVIRQEKEVQRQLKEQMDASVAKQNQAIAIIESAITTTDSMVTIINTDSSIYGN